MKAMVFAAGLGTRLRPLTDHTPKALVKVGGITLLERSLRRLAEAGATEAIVNIHHHPGQMREFISSLRIPGLQVSISDESEALLDTGGGLLHAAWFLREAGHFWLCNADILTDLDLRRLHADHVASGAMATLAVKQRMTSRYLRFDASGRLCGWENEKTGEVKTARECSGQLQKLAFSGIQVIHSGIFQHIRWLGVFSLIDLYLDLAADHAIRAWRDDESIVWDLGKVSEIEKAEEWLRLK